MKKSIYRQGGRVKIFNMGLPKKGEQWNVLFLSDIHSHESANQQILTILKAFQLTDKSTRKIVLGGDILDIKWLYQKDDAFKLAMKNGWWDEYFFYHLDKEKIWWESLYELLRTIVENDEDIIFIEGNHEERLRRKYFAPKIPHDLKHNFDLAHIIGAENRGIKLIGYKDWLKIAPLKSPPLLMTHGHYVGPNFLKKHFEDLNSGSILVGHLHELGSKSFKREGNTVTCYANPCLCDLEAEYMENRATNWDQGATQISVTRRDLSIHQYKIVNKSLYLPNGEVL